MPQPIIANCSKVWSSRQSTDNITTLGSQWMVCSEPVPGREMTFFVNAMNLKTGKQERDFYSTGSEKIISMATLNERGLAILVGKNWLANTGSVHVLDVETKARTSLEIGEDIACIYQIDNNFLASMHVDKERGIAASQVILKVWHVENNGYSLISQCPILKEALQRKKLTKVNNNLFIVTANQLLVWDLKTPNALPQMYNLDNQDKKIVSVTFLPEKKLVVGFHGGGVIFYDEQANKLKQLQLNMAYPVLELLDDKHLIVWGAGQQSSTFHVWNFETQQCVNTIQLQQEGSNTQFQDIKVIDKSTLLIIDREYYNSLVFASVSVTQAMLRPVENDAASSSVFSGNLTFLRPERAAEREAENSAYSNAPK